MQVLTEPVLDTLQRLFYGLLLLALLYAAAALATAPATVP